MSLGVNEGGGGLLGAKSGACEFVPRHLLTMCVFGAELGDRISSKSAHFPSGLLVRGNFSENMLEKRKSVNFPGGGKRGAKRARIVFFGENRKIPAQPVNAMP